jgi:hypothetical protein
MDRVGPRVARLLEHLLGLDDLVTTSVADV